jgi:hypothetical protein
VYGKPRRALYTCTVSFEGLIKKMFKAYNTRDALNKLSKEYAIDLVDDKLVCNDTNSEFYECYVEVEFIINYET